jgi:anti-sigma regulatory factor (Ser/Thr protein kinase)
VSERKTYTLTMRNHIPEIERLHGVLDDLRERHDLGDGEVFALTLALDEVLTNTISYGYDDELEHDIEITFAVDPGEIVITVRDDGRAFNPLERETPDLDAPVEERTIGGLGIHLVRNFMDDLAYERQGNWNVFTMRKRLGLA